MRILFKVGMFLSTRHAIIQGNLNERNQPNAFEIRGDVNERSSTYITSMFVERMEVLKYRQKFEVELSTFPDSTNTETLRKLDFSLTCVCVCVCLSVRKCLSVDILRKS